MTLLCADTPTDIDIPANEGRGEEPSPVHLRVAVEPAEFDRLAEYACTAGGFAASIEATTVLTMFLEATDETSYVAAAQQSALDAIAAGFTVTEFDYDLVNISDIANRINRSRQAIYQYIEGRRGHGGFPAPFGHAGQSDIWDWGTVNTWFRDFDGSGDPCYLPPRIVLTTLNSWLSRQIQHHQ